MRSEFEKSVPKVYRVKYNRLLYCLLYHREKKFERRNGVVYVKCGRGGKIGMRDRSEEGA